MAKKPKPKIKHQQIRITCPVCNKPIIGNIAKVKKTVVNRDYECKTPMCGYYYGSDNSGYSEEVFGPIVLIFSKGVYAPKPGDSGLFKSLKELRRQRLELLRETSEIWNHPECQIIFECMQSPNANHVGLSKTFLAWLKKRKRRFPNTYQTMAEKIKYEDQKEGRQADSEDSHGDDRFEPGAGPDC